MNCRTCGYRLWNLPARICPECGSPFKPSEFRFTINSVQYLCPHCEQMYYGTDPDTGHLMPRSFICVKCAQLIDMDEMVLRPAAGINERSTEATVTDIPWLQRRQIGTARAWLGTCGAALVKPTTLGRAIEADTSAREAWSFFLITNVLVPGVAALIYLLFVGLVSGGLGGGETLVMAAAGLAYIVLMVIGAGVSILFARFVMSLAPTRGHRVGANVTTAAVCYSAGVLSIQAVPGACVCFQFWWFTWAWWLVGAAIMLAQTHRVSGFRATIAAAPVFLVPVAAIGAAIGAFALGTSSMVGAFAAGPGGAVFEVAATQGVCTAVHDSAMAAGGTPPAHAITLVTSDRLTPFALLLMPWHFDPSIVPVAGTSLTLMDLMGSTPSAKAGAEAASAASLPPGVVAHRLGDYVFTWHGIDFTTADPRLWVVIQSVAPDVPSSNPARATVPSGMMHAGCADGTVYSFPANNLATELAAQNTIRQSLGLPLLPDPVTVTHAAPAVGIQPATAPATQPAGG